MEHTPLGLAERDLLALKEKIHAERGLDSRQYRDSYLRRRIDIRLRAHRLNSYRSYIHFLDAHPEEWQPLIDCLTVNVTHFFRNASMFEVLRSQVLPKLMAAKKERGKRVLRLWSAACSSGEEPYSLAILIREILGPAWSDWYVVILGTDLDENCLERAQLGVYGWQALTETSPEVCERYFEPGADRTYRVVDEIRRAVRFQAADLLMPSPLRSIDLLLCRNVLIYFAKEVQAQILSNLTQSVSPGGYLVIGKTESLSGPVVEQLEPVDVRERIYRRSIREALRTRKEGR